MKFSRTSIQSLSEKKLKKKIVLPLSAREGDARQCSRCSQGEPARRFPRRRRIHSPFRSPLLAALSPSFASSLVHRAGRRLFSLLTEQQPAIRRATPFCSLAPRKSTGPILKSR
ncbi:hypothetical protein PUN28_004068 [Cardiocondyla obscurior]|uniref:Uncharacterized protein n=1 Tax=Cardiocondyla obscurior TaxID=286306 RepID=A0AAW2GN32_9HYME